MSHYIIQQALPPYAIQSQDSLRPFTPHIVRYSPVTMLDNIDGRFTSSYTSAQISQYNPHTNDIPPNTRHKVLPATTILLPFLISIAQNYRITPAIENSYIIKFPAYMALCLTACFNIISLSHAKILPIQTLILSVSATMAVLVTSKPNMVWHLSLLFSAPLHGLVRLSKTEPTYNST